MTVRCIGVLLAAVLAAALAGDAGAVPAEPLQTPSPSALHLVATSIRQTKAMVQRALALKETGNLAEAETLMNQAIAVEIQRGSNRVGPLRTFLASIYIEQGRFSEAEPLLKAALGGGKDRMEDISPSLSLAQLYLRQGRFGDAESFAGHAVALCERFYAPDEPATGEALSLLGSILASTGRNEEALPVYNRALALFQRKPRENSDEIAMIQLNTGNIYQTLGRYEEALALHGEAYELDVKRFGSEHPNTIMALTNGAVDLELSGQYDKAAPLFQRALDVTQGLYGADHLKTALTLNNLGWLEVNRKNYAKALETLRPALAVYRANRELQKGGPAAEARAVDERQVGRTILGLITASRGLADAGPADADALLAEAFLAGQEVHRGKAAQALALTTARFASGTGPLADLIREREDLAARRAALDGAVTQALAVPADRRDGAALDKARADLAAMAQRIMAIDERLRSEFPAYSGMADPRPLTVAEVQAVLSPDEALVFATAFGGSNGEGAFLFVITRNEARWRAMGVGLTELTRMVLTLRCGLDVGAWDGEAGAATCATLTKVDKPGDELPFDAGVAHQLFTTLFGDLAPVIAGKSLVVVTSDPLTSLPLQVLLTEPPARGASYRSMAWLGRNHAIAVLPSVAGLRGLRAGGPVAAAAEPFIGFGDPTLKGSRRCPRAAVPDGCPGRGGTGTARAMLMSRGGTSLESVARGQGDEADVDQVRALCPLPETALELKCVAESLAAPPSMVRIGPEATVPAVLGEALDRFRIIHFATHGLLAGDIQTASGAVTEPALVLTPPETASPQDDGLLRTSAIAGLKLNADWVILSACNTAAGASLGGEAMSGLASAFLYAGARALLVSQWPVRSDAAVLLTTGALGRMAADARIGRAEAMRLAMVALIDGPDEGLSHPSSWAPFSVVGEGAPGVR